MITIVFDNYPSDPSLRSGFGFACVVETGDKKILFDTGSEGDLLLENLQKLNIPPTEIDFVVLSHDHWDHTGGLKGFLRENSKLTVYLPKSFSKGFKNDLRDKGVSVVEVDKALKICDGIHTTGELSGVIKEQSLVCESGRGLVVITGCAHPGIVRIVKEARKLSEDIHLIMGGFHLHSESDSVLVNIIEEFMRLGVNKVCPSHCTGDLAREMFLEYYGENCILGGVGTKIEVSSD